MAYRYRTHSDRHHDTISFGGGKVTTQPMLNHSIQIIVFSHASLSFMKLGYFIVSVFIQLVFPLTSENPQKFNEINQILLKTFCVN